MKSFLKITRALLCALWTSAVLTISTGARAQALPEAASTGGLTLLVGESVEWARGTRQPVRVDLTTTAAAVLGARVEDKTTTGEKLAATEGRLAELTALKPALVILFSGAADEKDKTPDDEQVAVLTRIGKAVTGAGARLFVVPSRTTVSASASANLRIGASAGGGTFVDTGSEYNRMPYEETLSRIAALRERKPGVFEMKPLTTSQAGTQPGSEAGTGVARSIPTPTGGEILTSGGVRTVRADPSGTPATIYMTPPPALKQFNPRKPVAPSNKSKKAPAAAR